MPGMHTPPDLSLPALDRLREIVKTLRSPGGCPWDIEQTQQSLIPNILEEAYEAADAIRSGNIEHMREELGDLLLQVVMQCEIASETGKFVIEDVAHDVTEKLVRRHPQVRRCSSNGRQLKVTRKATGKDDCLTACRAECLH
jgi:XTP/dITP diphosphohydrolase